MRGRCAKKQCVFEDLFVDYFKDGCQASFAFHPLLPLLSGTPLRVHQVQTTRRLSVSGLPASSTPIAFLPTHVHLTHHTLHTTIVAFVHSFVQHRTGVARCRCVKGVARTGPSPQLCKARRENPRHVPKRRLIDTHTHTTCVV